MSNLIQISELQYLADLRYAFCLHEQIAIHSTLHTLEDYSRGLTFIVKSLLTASEGTDVNILQYIGDLLSPHI